MALKGTEISAIAADTYEGLKDVTTNPIEIQTILQLIQVLLQNDVAQEQSLAGAGQKFGV